VSDIGANCWRCSRPHWGAKRDVCAKNECELTPPE